LVGDLEAEEVQVELEPEPDVDPDARLEDHGDDSVDTDPGFHLRDRRVRSDAVCRPVHLDLGADLHGRLQKLEIERVVDFDAERRPHTGRHVDAVALAHRCLVLDVFALAVRAGIVGPILVPPRTAVDPQLRDKQTRHTAPALSHPYVDEPAFVIDRLISAGGGLLGGDTRRGKCFQMMGGNHTPTSTTVAR